MKEEHLVRIFKFTLIIFSIWALLAHPVCSEDGKNIYELDEVVVTAPREDIPEYVQDVIPEEEISRPTTGGSVLDTLRNEAGIQFMRTSLVNSENNKLRMRGFDETRLKVLIDGVPMQRDGSYGGGGPVHWSTLSTEDIKRIEIHRGAGPAKFGNTFGGVINIITKKPSDKPETAISTVYGSLDTWDTKLSHSAKIGYFKWSLAASHFETDGYLRNNYMNRNNISGELALELPSGFEIGLGMDYSDMETGMAVYNREDSPFYDDDYPDADEQTLGGPGTRMINGALTWGEESCAEDQNKRFRAYLSKFFENGSANLSYQLWSQEKTEYYYDAADKSKKIYERETEVEDNNWSVQGDFEYNLNKHKIGLGGEFRRYGWGDQTVPYIDTEYFSPSINFFYYVKQGFKGQPDNKTYTALYAQDMWQFHPKWDLEFGVRQEWFGADKVDPAAFGYEWEADEAELDESNLDPRLALTCRPWAGGSLMARFGVVHRYPTSPEHFWWYLNKGSGFFNTELNVEKAKQYELAFGQSLSDTFDIAIRGYYYDIEDYISDTFVSGTGNVVYNIEEVEVKGAEAEVSVWFPRNFRLWANFTWQDGDKDGDPWDIGNRLSNELPDFPDTMFNIGMDYHGERIRANLSLNYVSSREHYDGQELIELDDYTLLNFSASYRLWQTKARRLEILLSGENLLDQDYEEKRGYPMPGATIMGGVRAVF